MKNKSYKYLNIITVAFTTILLLSNIVASIKITEIHLPNFSLGSWNSPSSISFAAGLFFFPISYLIGDLLTEVYGYAVSRRIIWTGFATLFISNIIIAILVALPAHPNWGLQESYEEIFGASIRVSAASMIAYFCGEFVNSFVIAKLKVLTQGKAQALRIISSTAAGEFIDTLIFYPLAFLGNPNFPPMLIINIMLSNYIIKVLWEVIAYPLLTTHLIKYLKTSEKEDFYDRRTNFSPFG